MNNLIAITFALYILTLLSCHIPNHPRILKENKKNETNIREMEQTSKALVFLATVLYVAVLVTPGAAHDQPPTFPVDINKCW